MDNRYRVKPSENERTLQYLLVEDNYSLCKIFTEVDRKDTTKNREKCNEGQREVRRGSETLFMELDS